MRSLQELEERDRKDTEREHSPLIPAEDSVIIDTSNLNPEGVVKKIKITIKEYGSELEQLLDENLSTVIMKQGSLVTGIVIDILDNHVVCT